MAITGPPRRETDQSSAELVRLLTTPRYEVLPLPGIVERIRAAVPQDIKLTVTASPKLGLEHTLDVVEELSGYGYVVVPHISARLVTDESHLASVLARLARIGVRDIFVIAGDAAEPAGQFEGAVELLTAMGERRAQFADIGIGGYPESHHLISDDVSIIAMHEKASMATYIVSQLCFDPATLAGWIARVRARGTMLPIWVGVPGSVHRQKLMRISMKIGLGESTRFLRSHLSWITNLAARRHYTPERLLRPAIKRTLDAGTPIAGLHIYTFNEIESTEAWRQEMLARHGAAASDGSGRE